MTLTSHWPSRTAIIGVRSLRSAVPASKGPEMKWQPIETVPRGDVLRYEPAEYRPNGDLSLSARIVISSGAYPRKATHWMPLPEPPEAKP